ncbi:MAG: hypothetical protein E5Y32_02390 [Mesorhizobium sp.]|nr:MAG: hypothetical protein E5Y32_02390 [Mesorhizobium sp.]
MAQTVDTNGWHTIAAIKYADVNKAIARDKKGPTKFDQGSPDGKEKANGNFGPWTLTTGGAGTTLIMELPIIEGTITIDGTAYPITACVAKVAVKATFLPQSGSSVESLVNDKSQPVSVAACEPVQSDFAAAAALPRLLETWLNSNLSEFNAVFASVDLDADYNVGMDWLKPSFRGYAVAEPAYSPTLENSVFAVMCLIDNTDEPAGLLWQISPYAIPPTAKGAFLVAPEKFLEHMILPVVPAMFTGIKDAPARDHFRIDNAGTRICNRTDVKLMSVKLDNHKEVSPAIAAQNFAIQLESGEIVLSIADMTFEYSPGITLHLNYTLRCGLTLSENHLDFTVLEQTGSGSVEVSKGLDIAQIVLGATSIVLALVSGGTGAVSKVADAAIVSTTEATTVAVENAVMDENEAELAVVNGLKGIIKGTVPEVRELSSRLMAVVKVAVVGGFCCTLLPAFVQIMQAIANGDYNKIPRIGDLVNDHVGKTVKWPADAGGFVLNSAQLNGALQFGLIETPTNPS